MPRGGGTPGTQDSQKETSERNNIVAATWIDYTRMTLGRRRRENQSMLRRKGSGRAVDRPSHKSRASAPWSKVATLTCEKKFRRGKNSIMDEKCFVCGATMNAPWGTIAGPLLAGSLFEDFEGSSEKIARRSTFRGNKEENRYKRTPMHK